VPASAAALNAAEGCGSGTGRINEVSREAIPSSLALRMSSAPPPGGAKERRHEPEHETRFHLRFTRPVPG
jgi:hypothetical protein